MMVVTVVRRSLSASPFTSQGLLVVLSPAHHEEQNGRGGGNGGRLASLLASECTLNSRNSWVTFYKLKHI
ncbi:hypothetical protein E2C01_051228 [Portunus trituberculatus]|uniref:Uncharacterized protein n=1 Tax=Portunus trituberculatus TaxID=210409 RepID=A0A5B7GAE6_PORTR|nr:hypothetical protein [Portunus trituberculatus]